MENETKKIVHIPFFYTSHGEDYLSQNIKRAVYRRDCLDILIGNAVSDQDIEASTRHSRTSGGKQTSMARHF
jgi:hypothetical protein